MRLTIIALAAGTLGLAACGTTVAQAPAAPTVTKTAAPAPASPTAAAPAPSAAPGVTDPWAVVSAYYGDIESGDYPGAWVLLGSGAVTGQTYQQFAGGFSCTGGQQVTDQGESGDQVSFTLAATDRCTGMVQQFSGTDTVSGGKIVAAHIIRTG
ncbi:MAG TPA: hypothetical protein VGH88_10740 [Streptosporangiaceae bacterium]|jgi:curli biogenesis system outer membrane secretion channel CsgG